MDIRTSQAMDRSRRHHTVQLVHIHFSPILTRLCCGKPSEVVPSFPFVWKKLERHPHVLLPHVKSYRRAQNHCFCEGKIEQRGKYDP